MKNVKFAFQNMYNHFVKMIEEKPIPQTESKKHNLSFISNKTQFILLRNCTDHFEIYTLNLRQYYLSFYRTVFQSDVIFIYFEEILNSSKMTASFGF